MSGGETISRAFLTRIAGLIPPFTPADTPPPRSLWPFARWCLAGTFPVLAMGATVSALAGTTEVVVAMMIGWVVDLALSSGPEAVFTANKWQLLAMAVVFLVIRPLVFGLSSLFQSVAIAPSLNVLVLSRLHRWTLGQAITFFDNDFAGRLAQKQMQAARALTDVTVEALNTLVFALASVVATAVFLIAIDWRVGVLLLVWLIAYVRFITWFLPVVRGRSAARASARAIVTGQVVDTITNMRTVKLFAHDDHEDQAAIEAMDGYRDTTRHYGEIASLFRLMMLALAGVVPVMLIGATLWMWQHGLATPGDIAAAGAMSMRIAQMTGWVSFTMMTMYAGVGEVEDGMRTLTPPHTLTDAPDAEPLKAAGPIVFDDVSFAYGKRSGGLDHVSLTIAPGEKIGIVGASGAGKSTLVALLLRLYDPEDGQVMIGGQNIAHVTQESLRRNIGMVTQETAMFNRTARENILYGRPDAPDEEMVEAARRAEAHDFILELRDHRNNTGYDTFLGERGVKLSGGQRQRIALARAILKDAPILVLDEATSALDSEVEAEIEKALAKVMEGKTVLAIAHRLSTIARMDRIVVMDDGRIVEEGTHKDLLKQGGIYARFWNRQSGGFIGIAEAAE